MERGNRFVLNLYRRYVNSDLGSERGSVVSHYIEGLCVSVTEDGRGCVPMVDSFCSVLVTRPRSRTGSVTLSLRLFMGNSLGVFGRRAGISISGEFAMCNVESLNARLDPVAVLIVVRSVRGEVIRGNGQNGTA